MATNDLPPQPPSLLRPPANPAPHTTTRRTTRAPTGSGTQTVTSAPPSRTPSPPLVLRLRGAHSPQPHNDNVVRPDDTHRPRQPRIQWASDVVDNEGLGRKKSKVCCIYHKPRAVGESSDESSDGAGSSSDSSDAGSSAGDDDDDDDDGARPSRKMGRGRKGHGRGRNKHEHGHGHGHGDADGKGKGKAPRRRPSPNAYEKMPRYDVEPLARQPGQ